MKILPLIIIITVFLAGNFYVFYRLWQMMPPNLSGRIALIVIGILAASSMFLFFGLISSTSVPAIILSSIYKIGTSWIFILLYLFMIMLVLDILKITHIFPLEKVLHHNWWGFAGVLGVLTLIMTAGYIKYNHKDRVELNLHTHKIKSSDISLKVVAISDLHLGYGIGKQEFQKWVKLINKENPDVVLIAGDLIDNSVKPLYEEDMQSVFSEIKSTYGIYMCPGNHEYISNISESIEFLNNTSVHFLKDSVALVADKFYIVGRDDRSNPRRKPLSQLVDSLDTTKPIIVLDHQPYNLEDAEANRVDLQISGHTHRGQVWPISWITDKIYEDSHGYIRKGDTHIFVSSGLGIWGGKFRIGTQSEYVVVNLQP